MYAEPARRRACRAAAPDMLFLRQVGSKTDRGAAGRKARTSDGQPADFLRRRHIAFEQRRRQIANRDVVETVAGRVARQHRRRVEFQRQQIANRVLIFGAVEAAERIRSAWIGSAAESVSSEASSEASAAARSASSGCRAPAAASAGRASFRTTFSHTSQWSPSSLVLIASSSSPPAFDLLL